METAISKAAALGLVALALTLCGCGEAASSTTPSAPALFAWLHPGPPPSGWREVTIPSGAELAYPPGWRLIQSDRGSASAALLDRGLYVGYLNITPRQSNETLGDWGRFRVQHNAKEGDRQVVTLAVGSGLRFRRGSGSCVKDSYATVTRARFIELACLVVGRTASDVIVGATPPQDWSRISPLLERAISSVTTGA